MAETVEYALVVMASALFVAGSVVTYGSFSSFESSLQFRAEFQEVSSLASAALVNGSSRASLSLPTSTIGCSSGVLSVVAGPMNMSLGIGFPCEFHLNVIQGSHVLVFSVEGARLTAGVS
jgi:hypothetical protein